jgi:hypothetical protein
LNPERWEKIKQLLDSALAQEASVGDVEEKHAIYANKHARLICNKVRLVWDHNDFIN